MKTHPEILIVGAGPTGLSAAVELARHGVIPDIVERRVTPSTLSRAVGILPETLAKLDHGGIAGAIRGEAMNFRKIRIFRGERLLLELDFSAPEYDGKVICGLPQNRTEEILREGLERYGGTVEFGKEIVFIAQHGERVGVRFSDGEERTYDWVIAADGVGSTIRKGLGIGFPGIDLEGEWSIADVDVEDYDPSCFTAWIQSKAGEFVLVLPIERNRVRIASSTSDAIAAIPAPLKITKVRREGRFKIAVRQAESYRKGRVLLAGDAAHCHSPVGGRGMNLGIDDAMAAANAILDGTTDRYSEERRAIGRHVLRTSEQGRRLFCTSNPLITAGTTIFMRLAQRIPGLHGSILKRLTSLRGPK
ncbi:MAG: FAD-dependent oxidoreductase [Verrucomicrobiaceae bacterium]